MKAKLLLAGLLIGIIQGRSQSWDWAHNAYGTGTETVECSTTDLSGNVYVAGTYRDSVLMIGSYALVNNSTWYDMYVAKYDASGNVSWAQTFGGPDNESPASMTKDAFGNIYLAGSFSSPTVTFGSYTLVRDTNFNMFLVKMDQNGTVQWAITSDSISVEYIRAISCDASGNIYITGGFMSPTLTLGSNTLTNTSFTFNEFTAKVDPQGTILWAKSIGCIGTTSASSVGSAAITVDQSGNCYVAGIFGDSIIIIENDTLVRSGYSDDVFLVKYDTYGNKIWSRVEGKHDGSFEVELATDPAGNIFMGGSFNSPTITFGSFTLQGPYTFQWPRIFLVKFAPDASVLWAKTSDDANAGDYTRAIATDAMGNAFLAGDHKGPIVFGSYSVTRFSGPPADIGMMDPPPYGRMFIAMFDPNGNIRYATGIGGNRYDHIISVTPDGFGNIFVSGDFTSDTVRFGPSTLVKSTTYYNYYISDMFVAKMSLGPLGINEMKHTSLVSVSPNPSSGIFTISSAHAFDRSKICIYDITGNCIREVNNGNTFDLGDQAQGTYLLEIIDEGGRWIERIVLE